MTNPISTAQLLVTYAILSASSILAPAAISKNGFPTTPEAKVLLARAANEFSVLRLDRDGEIYSLVEDLGDLASENYMSRSAFKKAVLEIINELRTMEHTTDRPRVKKGDSKPDREVTGYGAFPGWSKGSDGVWRNPRYSSNEPPTAENFAATYDPENGCALLTMDGRTAPISLDQLHALNGQTQQIIKQIQAENSLLWKEKAQIQFLDTGYLPPHR